MNFNLNQLSTRELQAYGAACLVKFCAANNIFSSAILSLIEHLLLVLTCSDLPSWEADGATLELSGRGDPLPDDLVRSITLDLVGDFQRLVESVVAIGLVDMYGGQTHLPLKFLLESCDVLKDHSVELPVVEELFSLRNRAINCGWGAPMPVERYEHLRAWCIRTLGREPGA